MRNFERKFGRDRGRYARGQSIELPKIPGIDDWLTLNDFSGGYNSLVASEDTPQNFSPLAINMEVTRKNRLRRAPGTTTVDSLAGHDTKQIALHASLDARAELLLFAPPELGVKEVGAPTWTDLGLPEGAPYAWANFGGTFIFSNGRDKVFLREPRNLARSAPKIPIARTFASFGGRLFAGAVALDGKYEPLGIAWSGTSGDPEDFLGDGSGGEALINEMSAGDRVVSLRAMSFDFLAILCRHSIWAGTFTGLANRPADFKTRQARVGTINDQVVQLSRIGVIFVSDDGVRAFDGSDAPIISHQINNDLLPLDLTKLDEYSSAYDIVDSLYYLYTPTGTWVYDIERQRWFRRAMVAKSGAIFSTQFAGKTWDDMAGFTWASLAGQTWADLAPEQGEAVDMMFLGNDGTNDLLAKEDPVSELVWGNVTTLPFWDFPTKEGQFMTELWTAQQLYYRYIGSGTVRIYLTDNDGVPDLITQQQLPSVAIPTTVALPMLHTGLGMGVRLEYGSGPLETSRIQVALVRRGPRLEAGLAFPREYYPDF